MIDIPDKVDEDRIACSSVSFHEFFPLEVLEKTHLGVSKNKEEAFAMERLAYYGATAKSKKPKMPKREKRGRFGYGEYGDEDDSEEEEGWRIW